MKNVTVWSRYTDARRFEFNHVEDGHIPYEQQTPTCNSALQKRSWSSALWVKQRGHLTDKNEVVID